MTEIPELPLFRFIDCDGEWYKAEDMRSFYAQGVREGMERAAVICDELPTKHEDADDLLEELIQMDCAAAIRAEAAKGAGEER